MDTDVARLSTFLRTHLGVDGHYSFYLPDLGGTHRRLRDPDATDGESQMSSNALQQWPVKGCGRGLPDRVC
ncbi:hypothetical protein [Nocardia sp. NPDC003963]